jgi:NAD(P)-dependent dehydrogenase (short-subunit alcohol dehydrogenase family)
VNNAAVVNLERQESVDGYELMFATNHLGPFLLTNLLLDRIKESAPARIVFVGSDGHKLDRIDFDDLHSLKTYGVMKTYGKAKSGNNLMMLELVGRLEGSGVTVNCLHPGAVDTKLGDNHGFLARMFGRLVKTFLMSSAKGAKTPLYLATSPEVEGVTGKYFYRCKEHPQAPYVLDKGEAKRLWEISEKLTGFSRD